MKVAIAYLTKDRPELTEQTGPRMPFDHAQVFSIDGSVTKEGKMAVDLAMRIFGIGGTPPRFWGVGGGADAAIVLALTNMLKHSDDYTHVGLCENDVLLAPDWFERTMALFEKGEADGLSVGAVSARAYDDRILIQRDGYAVMHNLGAGQVIFTRLAAELILANYRTGWWPDNRAIFAQLSGIDIGRYACFRGSQQWCTADWHFDAILGQHGLAPLALTPCAAEMIGQEPSLEEQGLRLVDREVEQLRNDEAFRLFAKRTKAIRDGRWTPQTVTPVHRTSMNAGAALIFPHQLNAEYSEGWRLKWTQGFGPFSYRADAESMLLVDVFGPCVFLVSGGERGAKVTIRDTASGYEIDPEVPPTEHGITQLAVPGGVSYREIEMTCSAGAVFYGIQCQEPQPISNRKFDYSTLPPV